MARESGELLLGIINDILDISKIEAGKLELDRIQFDLRALVEETVELFGERGHRKGLEIVCSLAEDVPALVEGDSLRLRQILSNLLGNAIKFTAEGEVLVRVAPVETSGTPCWYASTSATPVSGSPRTSRTGSSNRSRRPTARPRASTVAPGWGWRSPDSCRG